MMGSAPGDGGTKPSAVAHSQDSLPEGAPPEGALPDAVRHRADTGDPRVDDAFCRLDDLADLPLAEHPKVFEYVHERLAEALDDLDVHERAQPGREPGEPGGSGTAPGRAGR